MWQVASIKLEHNTLPWGFDCWFQNSNGKVTLWKLRKKMTFKKWSCFVQPWDLAQIKTVQLCSNLSRQSLGLDYGFSYLPLQSTIQKNFLERYLNVSFQFITIKVEVSTHEKKASEETVEILKNAFECPNVVWYIKYIWKWWLFVINYENVSDSMHFSSRINPGPIIVYACQ